MSTQTTGLVLAAVGATLLWSPWALLVAGVLLMVVPDLIMIVQRRRRYVAARAAWLAAQGRGGKVMYAGDDPVVQSS